MEILKQVLNRRNLGEALRKVEGNRGSGGVDGMGVKELPKHLRQHWPRISKEILNGQYHPQPVLGVEIPKDNGGVRLLGIPTVTDRVIQQAIHQVLSPLYEPEFSDYSYGFRPGRNAHQALEQAKKYINEGYQEIIDLDLKSFFDKVNHDILMSLLIQKVKDRNLLKLIRRYLQSGLLLDGVCSPRLQGTPQGGPLSPLLSNILLNELDKELERRGLRFIRYADDCSIFVRSRRSAIRVLRTVTRFLKEHLRLEVNEEKTGIRRPVKFELLGYGFVPTYQKGVKGKYNFRVSAKSFKKLKLKLKAITRKTIPMSFDERIDKLLALMRGWVNYFKLAKMWGKLKELDVWIRNRLRYCIWKQWKRPNRRMKNFIRMGVEHGLAYAWSRSRLGGWRIACSPIMKTTVTLDRLARRGYQSFEQYYLKRIHV